MNKEAKTQLDDAMRILKRNKPMIWDEDSGSVYQSRRIKGMFTTAGERYGYRHVYCYIEKGLAGREETINEILKEIIQYQRKRGFSNSCLFVASFGGEGDEFKCNRSVFRLQGTVNIKEITKNLADLAGTDSLPSDEMAVMKRLFPIVRLNYTDVTFPRREDILIIFHSRRELLMEKKVRSSYLKQLKSHTVWVTFDGDESTIESGRNIKPGVWVDQDQEKKSESEKKETETKRQDPYPDIEF